MKNIKYIVPFFLAIVLCGIFIYAHVNRSEPENNINPTGCSGGEIEQPQFMYNGVLYCYYATGFHDELPEDYCYIGEIEKVNNYEKPSGDFEGARVEAGQKFFGNGEIDILYLQYESGYAKFTQDVK